jgi:hypothetical protein
MRVDFSTVALLLLVVLPGYCAFKVRNQLSPRSFAAKGPTEELASFVALSVLTHIALAWIMAAGMALAGILTAHNAFYWFGWADRTDLIAWLQLHKSSGALLLSAYFLALCAVGMMIGAALALSRLSLPRTVWAVVTAAPRFRGLLRRFGHSRIAWRNSHCLPRLCYGAG